MSNVAGDAIRILEDAGNAGFEGNGTIDYEKHENWTT